MRIVHLQIWKPAWKHLQKPLKPFLLIFHLRLDLSKNNRYLCCYQRRCNNLNIWKDYKYTYFFYFEHGMDEYFAQDQQQPESGIHAPLGGVASLEPGHWTTWVWNQPFLLRGSLAWTSRVLLVWAILGWILKSCDQTRSFPKPKCSFWGSNSPCSNSKHPNCKLLNLEPFSISLIISQSEWSYSTNQSTIC